MSASSTPYWVGSEVWATHNFTFGAEVGVDWIEFDNDWEYFDTAIHTTGRLVVRFYLN